jgi:hypothetical protein
MISIAIQKVKTSQLAKFVDMFLMVISIATLLFIVYKSTIETIVNKSVVIVPGESITISWDASKEDWVAAYNEYKKIKGVKSDTH